MADTKETLSVANDTVIPLLEKNSNDEVVDTTTTKSKPHFMSSVYLRSTADFCGFGEAHAWSIVCDPAALHKRVQHNVSIFYLNYFRLTAVLFLSTCFIGPFALVANLVLAVLWMAAIYASKHDEQKLKNAGECIQSWMV